MRRVVDQVILEHVPEIIERLWEQNVRVHGYRPQTHVDITITSITHRLELQLPYRLLMKMILQKSLVSIRMNHIG